MNKISVEAPVDCSCSSVGIILLLTEHAVFQQDITAKASCCRPLVMNLSVQVANLIFSAPYLTNARAFPFSTQPIMLFFLNVAVNKTKLPTAARAKNAKAARHFKTFKAFSPLVDNSFCSSPLLFLNPGGTLSTPTLRVAANRQTQPMSSPSGITLFKHWYCKQHAKPELQKKPQVVHRYGRNLLQKLKSEKKALCSNCNGL
ncbi:hypothetical protein [Cesiribacter sp. SM1]|uniref:hypothetical protein n=1 Tax=Cesiribacter sp. SM1 TaxID=2861196 RepID=UPI001CD503A2|nr:hypothetical protein [Cesiribacter sp. SM1]